MAERLLDGRVVRVSGGTQGVGGGVARAAVAEGSSVVVTAGRSCSSSMLATTNASQPMSKLGQIDDIAPLVVLLLSERSGVVTGSVIDWDQQVLGGLD